MAEENVLGKFADLVREAKAAIRVDFQYTEAMARHAGTLISRQETKRQKLSVETAKSRR